MLEAYTTLGFLAAHTRRARLGTLVTGVHYRHPGVLVKQVTTLDVLSARARLAGHRRRLVRARIAGPRRAVSAASRSASSVSKRRSRSPTTCGAAIPQPFYGKHFQLAEPMNSPPPLSQPHPPILIGGGGEQKTLRLVARYADACNLFARYCRSVIWRASSSKLRGYCDEERPPVRRDRQDRADPVEPGPQVAAGRSSTSSASCASWASTRSIASLTGVETLKPIEILAARRLSAGRHVSSSPTIGASVRPRRRSEPRTARSAIGLGLGDAERSGARRRDSTAPGRLSRGATRPISATPRDVSWHLDGAPEVAAMEPTIRAILDRRPRHVPGRRRPADRGLLSRPDVLVRASCPAGRRSTCTFATRPPTCRWSRYYYGAPALRSTVEEFLREQYAGRLDFGHHRAGLQGRQGHGRLGRRDQRHRRRHRGLRRPARPRLAHPDRCAARR